MMYRRTTVSLHAVSASAAAKGWKLLLAREVLGDGVQAPGYVTLCGIAHAEEFAVHFFNAQDGGFYAGSYIRNADAAFDAYTERADRMTRHHINFEAQKVLITTGR